MTTRTKLKIVVQGPVESGAEFAERLEEICIELQKQFPRMNGGAPIIIPTSASDGRQTANIQFMLPVDEEYIDYQRKYEDAMREIEDLKDQLNNLQQN
jgi:inhibitor of KinA sporulation pathway (predicted exonuclease)